MAKVRCLCLAVFYSKVQPMLHRIARTTRQTANVLKHKVVTCHGMLSSLVISPQLLEHWYSHPIKQPSQDPTVDRLISASCKLNDHFCQDVREASDSLSLFLTLRQQIASATLGKLWNSFQSIVRPVNWPTIPHLSIRVDCRKTGTLFQPNHSVFDRAINIWVENSSEWRTALWSNVLWCQITTPSTSLGPCVTQEAVENKMLWDWDL